MTENRNPVRSIRVGEVGPRGEDGEYWTVAQLIEALRQFPPEATVGVHCHGCCPHAHSFENVNDNGQYESDVVIEA